jgi:hypothetical protein
MAELSASGTAPRALLWLLLGGWVGAWMLFGAVVAPTAFSVLPTSEVAGQVIGPVLAALHLYGGGAGVVLALLAIAQGRGSIRVAVPLVMSAACLLSHFGVSAQIAEIRDLAFGPGGSEATAARFTRLHQLSVGIYLGVGFAALGLTWLHARSDAAGETRRKSTKIP